MEEMKIQAEEQEIDLLEVFCVLWHRAWLLLLSLIIGAALAGAMTYFFATPVYQATSVICAFPENTDAEAFLTELEIGKSLAADFQILATTREVVEPALEACGIETPYESAVGSVSVAYPADSHMFQITVTDADPQLAAQLSNALGDQLKLKIAEVMRIDTPSTIEYASVPAAPINDNLKRNCAAGGLVFLMLAAGAVLLVHFLKDSVKETMGAIRRSSNG